jgi:hypothetical protein
MSVSHRLTAARRTPERKYASVVLDRSHILLYMLTHCCQAMEYSCRKCDLRQSKAERNKKGTVGGKNNEWLVLNNETKGREKKLTEPNLVSHC